MAIAGYGGTVDGACNSIKNWSFTSSRDVLDSSGFCSNSFREHVLGLQGATGTLASTVRFTGAATISLANTLGGVTISGDVSWNEEGIDNDVEGIQEYTLGFTFNGEWTIV